MHRKSMIFFSLFLLICLLVPAYAEETSAYTFRTVSLDDIESKDSGGIESTFYPSGLSLPTKYLDVVSFLPIKSSESVDPSVLEFLKINWPCEQGYTYAEYRAAVMYLGLVEMASYSDDTLRAYPETSSIAATVLDNLGIKLQGNTSTVLIGDLDRFKSRIVSMSDGLSTAAVDELPSENPWLSSLCYQQSDGLYYSAGFNFDWMCHTTTADETYDEFGRNFLTGLQSYLDAFGLCVEDTDNVVYIVLEVSEEDGTDSDESNDTVSSSATVEEQPEVQQDLPEVNRDLQDSVWEIQSQHRGLRDNFNSVCLVVCAFGVLFLLVDLWIKKRG